MASEISKFMSDYCAIAKKKPKTAAANDLSARSKRCKKVSEITRLMEQVRDAETISHENVPENLRGASAYEDAEDSLSRMDEVIELLETIY
jgi:HEPN domain-containing protein